MNSIKTILLALLASVVGTGCAFSNSETGDSSSTEGNDESTSGDNSTPSYTSPGSSPGGSSGTSNSDPSLPMSKCTVYIKGDSAAGWKPCENTSNCFEYDVGSIPVDQNYQIPKFGIWASCSQPIIVVMPEYAQPTCSATIGGDGTCPMPPNSGAEVPLDPMAYSNFNPYDFVGLPVRALTTGNFMVQCDLHDKTDPLVGHAILRVRGFAY